MLLLQALFPYAGKKYFAAALKFNKDVEDAVRFVHSKVDLAPHCGKYLIQSVEDTQPVRRCNEQEETLSAEAAAKIEKMKNKPLSNVSQHDAYNEVAIAFPVDTSSWDVKFIPPFVAPHPAASQPLLLPEEDDEMLRRGGPTRTPTLPWANITALREAKREEEGSTIDSKPQQTTNTSGNAQRLKAMPKIGVARIGVHRVGIERNCATASEDGTKGLRFDGKERHESCNISGSSVGCMDLLEFTVAKERECVNLKNMMRQWADVFSRSSGCFVLREIVLKCNNMAPILPDLITSCFSLMEQELCGRELVAEPTHFVSCFLRREYEVKLGPIKMKTVELSHNYASLEEGGKYLRICLNLRRIVLETLSYSYRNAKNKSADFTHGTVDLKVENCALKVDLIILLAGGGFVTIYRRCDNLKIGSIGADFSGFIPNLIFFIIKPIIRRSLRNQIMAVMNERTFGKT